MWPSPNVADFKLVGPKEMAGRIVKGVKAQTMLRAEVKRSLWPTPNATDNRDRGNMDDPCTQRRIAIGKQVGLTTIVQDGKTKTSGSLNPAWVEWLMGYPIGWTDLKDSETPLCSKLPPN
jgi:DNA (cytosine-5)-methyltransferase 1